MDMQLKGRDMLSLKNYTKEELEYLIDLGIKIKKNPEKYYDVLKKKTLIMLFEKSSTRTRCSFEAGMAQMGGHAIFLDWQSSQLSIGAELKDEVRSMERYCDVIAARVKKHKTIREIADSVKKPVINMLCEKYHPCQGLGDMMTIKEHIGSLKGKKLVYTGIANNVSNSLVCAGTKLGMKVVLAIPEKDPDAVDVELEKKAKATGLYEETKDLKSAVKDADIVYTDTWVNIEFMKDPKFAAEKERRMKTFMPYQVNAKLLKDTGSHAKIMHCLAAHVGYEITRDAIDHKNSIIFNQAENRMHIQKAILVSLVG
ncbi:MAG: ornithine carbamoyltransferase [Candidatus Aenigmarchaeota archaeon CG1_02_38_14]|nr:MAG: ornithine carbamoyltransferase [Candidatus Aenigmarchaeota archaeon CG1_02_38_14]